MSISVYLALPLVIFFAFPAAPLPFLRFAPGSLGPSTASYAARDSLALREVPSLSALFDFPIITCRIRVSRFERGTHGTHTAGLARFLGWDGVGWDGMGWVFDVICDMT